MRAVSTTVDVAVFLLLVTAAVATITIPTESAPETEVDPAADSLATATATLDYQVAVPAELYDAERRLVGNRTANRTLASLLADAAVNGGQIDGHPLRFMSDDYGERVVQLTRDRLEWVDGPVRVEVRWRAYPGSPINGTLALGQPGASRDAGTAVVVVPGPVDVVRDDAVAASGSGFEAVAAIVANATIEGFVPADRMRLALSAGGLPRALALARYDGLVRALEVNVVDALEATEPERANRRLADALTALLAADLQSRFASPRAAAESVSVGTVRIVVRGWDP